MSAVSVPLTEPYSLVCTSHTVVLLNWREDGYTARTLRAMKCTETLNSWRSEVMCHTKYVVSINTLLSIWPFVGWWVHRQTRNCIDFRLLFEYPIEIPVSVCTSHAVVLLNWREDGCTVRTLWAMKCTETLNSWRSEVMCHTKYDVHTYVSLNIPLSSPDQT